MAAESPDALSRYSGEYSRPTVFYNDWVKWGVYLTLLLFVLGNLWAVRIPLDRLLAGLEAGALLVSQMVPPEFGGPNAERIWEGMVETVAMSIVATAIGVALSIPIAVMAAENLVPRPVYYVGRAILSVSRAFHELVVGIVVVVGFGFGALAGVIALVFATPGFFAKLLAEDLEDIDETQVDAIRATGAGSLSVLVFGVLPQVVPRIIGLTIYRWDTNVRAATILGVVGAGGIGNVLIQSFDLYDYGFSAAIILSIIAVVMVGEILSAVARRRVQ
jgi:phosphonate transport system permease protein